MLRSDWHILACERVHVAPTKKQRHGNSCAPRALERYGAASPKVDYQLFAGSKNTPELRGRRAPQVRNGRTGLTKGMRHGRAKFLHYFPNGFRDPLYEDWERGYKWFAHERWSETLDQESFRGLLKAGKHRDIAAQAVAIEARTNLLFSFEKMALRDAVSRDAGARGFAMGLVEWLYGAGPDAGRFDSWVDTIAGLPRRQTRVLTWPAVTVFGFIARPRTHLLLKPNVMRHAADAYGYPLGYSSMPQWNTYASLLDFARVVRRDLRDLRPRDMIDIQSFLWVQGSDEYE
jgi:hypothetical protein